MSWDRDLYLDTFHNITNFASEGIDVKTRWNTALNANTEGWWLDPQGSDFGPNAKYFKYDPAEQSTQLSSSIPQDQPEMSSLTPLSS
jgi:hypothetical protein